MKKVISLLVLFVFVLALVACKPKVVVQDKVLVVGYDAFSEKFSPFFADTDMDQDVVDLVSVALLTTDRDGGIVYNSIEGETIARGSKSYEYKGISDLTVVYDEASNKTTYTMKLKQGVKFSDGNELDADDVIFTYYVILDPLYAGSSTLSSVDIVGYQNYKYNSTATDDAKEIADETWDDLIAAIGTGANATLENYVKAEIKALLASELEWVRADVITDDGWKAFWRKEDGTAATTKEEASATATFVYFYALEDYSVVGKTDETIVNDVANQYGLDYAGLDEMYGDSIVTPKVEAKAYDLAMKAALDTVQGQPVPNITGITKVNQYEVKVVVNGFDAAAVYQVAGITVAPMHYYGDASQYNYAENKFGFNNRAENSMEKIQLKTKTPLGAGPYVFKKFENNVVYFEANPNYYKGAPKTKYIRFQVVAEANKISSIATGDIDISNPSGSRTKFEEIRSLNTNKELSGNKIFTSSIDNLGYGYVGLNAYNIKVGTDFASNQSKALRKAFATVISSQRYTSVNSYYGDAASVIDYPISNTSWAAPKKGETGYEYAYSKNPDGSKVYGNVDPSTLSDSDRSAKAKLAAKLWLEAAGYTFVAKSGEVKFGDKLYTATAPVGAKLDYEVVVPADGVGDHPAFQMVTGFKNIMEELGITINIVDPTNSADLWDLIDSGQQEMWAAAWVATIDPDMYQVYHGNNTVIDGAPNTTESNHYHIKDAILNQKIIEARQSSNQETRKELYKDCLDIILDWGVEVPTYQRQNIITISAERVNLDTLTPDITTYWGWMNDIEKLEMK